MRKIKIIEHVSLDGVIQAPGRPDEDVDGGFVHGGWVVPHFDPIVGQAIDDVHAAPFDLLLGRRTYDIWSAYWPQVARNPMADSLNAATKYVATHRPESLAWGPVEALGADVLAGIRAAKAKPGPDLVVWGSSTLTPILLGRGLADLLVLLVYPVLLGRGKRLFAADADPCELALVSTQAAPSGVIVSTYEPRGPLRTGSFEPD
ncbi:dihydrofolate reductase family protein [Salinarimonas sp.]|uniref:dihydrofolate reductase family protein n=1 Tax=Salinarimonas sp. TaxID=2766526 RepID=UPI0032D9061C